MQIKHYHDANSKLCTAIPNSSQLQFQPTYNQLISLSPFSICFS
uniref:Uncharacterized protein n=1 Tax=Strigamia maritima TaxID=126957 RepID=T1J4K3_STRMM